MEPSSYCLLWNQAMVTRDNSVLQLSMMAVSIIAGWTMLDLLPGPWAEWARRIYRIGGIALYILTVVYAFVQVIYGPKI